MLVIKNANVVFSDKIRNATVICDNGKIVDIVERYQENENDNVIVKTTKKTSYTIKKLSSKKTYYVKVRAYKTISGTKYYGAYTSYKKLKIK